MKIDKQFEIERIKKGIEITKKYVDFAILKLSGFGEITLLDNFYSLLNYVKASKQIITNAYLLSKNLIDRLSEIEDIILCISLDGHTIETNFCRTGKKEVLLSKILENLKYASKKMPVEVYSVLTSYNTAKFKEFLDYLLSETEHVTCFPFPVRPFPKKANKSITPAIKDVFIFVDEILNYYWKFKQVLPGMKYIERLVEFMKCGKRQWPCYVSIINLGINPAGDVMVCSCGPKDLLGNIFKKPGKAFEYKKNFNQKNIDKLKWPECERCFTHYDILNLFFESSITLDELSMIPSFRTINVKSTLAQLK